MRCCICRKPAPARSGGDEKRTRLFDSGGSCCFDAATNESSRREPRLSVSTTLAVTSPALSPQGSDSSTFARTSSALRDGAAASAEPGESVNTGAATTTDAASRSQKRFILLPCRFQGPTLQYRIRALGELPSARASPS